jgi:DNA-binding LytR/AlgR family response regulator
MNCIIASDIVNSKHLVEYVGKCSSLKLIGTFTDSASITAELSKRQDIDLMFLDIDILEMNFIEFINNLSYKPNIILLSSNDKFAINAFDINVIDYLLKPVPYSRFFRAVDKAHKFFSPREVSNLGDNEIFIKKESALIKLKLKDIIYIEALENYVIVNTVDKKFTIHFTMKALENQLPAGIFIRIHRSFIVNKNKILAVKENSLDLMVGQTQKNFPIGDSFRDVLLKSLNIMIR